MTNNEIFRTVLHLTGVGLDKELTLRIFELGGIEATNSKVRAWRADLDNDRASMMPDFALRGFFQGLFRYRDKQLENGVNIFNLIDK